MHSPRSSRPLARLAVVLLATCLAAGATGVVSGGSAATAQPALRVETLRLPGLPGSTGHTEAHAVNNAGTIAGAATTATGVQHAALWVKGKIVDLDAGRTDVTDTAFGVNSSGQAVGQDDTAGYAPLLWRDGRRIVLRSPASSGAHQVSNCTALTIDDAGVIGGYCFVEENGTVSSIPVLWRDEVPSRPWRYGRVNAIGAAGHLAGFLGVGDNDQVLRATLDVGSGPVTLPTLGGEQDIAFDVNATDVVVGMSNGRPVVWRGGSVRALPARSGGGAAYGINRWGTVAGAAGGTLRPVVWKNGLLIPMGPSSGSATDINDRGDVVGWSTGTDTGAPRTAIRWHLVDDGA